jgi:hypothetical protein
MDLPTIEKGMAILADQINRISREVRSNALTSVEGGRFQRSTGGTSIQIDNGFWSVAEAALINCPFGLTDASGNDDVKVEVKQGMINNRWPEGMSIDGPPYYLTLSNQLPSYVYAVILWDTQTMQIKSEEWAISIADFTDLKENTDDTEYILIATVTVQDQKLRTITNVCTQPNPDPCTLDWSTV